MTVLLIKLPLVAQPGSVTLTSGNKTQTTDLGTKVDVQFTPVTIICRIISSSMVRWQFGITI